MRNRGLPDYSPYSIHDLAFDDPFLYQRIIRNAIEQYDGYGFDPEREWAYERENAAVKAAQWDTYSEQATQTKANRYDEDIQKIKDDLMWSELQPTDAVEVIFWQDHFDPLVSFARNTKRNTIVSLLEADYKELRDAGLSYDLLGKVSLTLRQWSAKLLHPEDDVPDAEDMPLSDVAVSDVSTDVAADIFSLFFAGSKSTEEGELVAASTAYSEYANNP